MEKFTVVLALLFVSACAQEPERFGPPLTETPLLCNRPPECSVGLVLACPTPDGRFIPGSPDFYPVCTHGRLQCPISTDLPSCHSPVAVEGTAEIYDSCEHDDECKSGFCAHGSCTTSCTSDADCEGGAGCYEGGPWVDQYGEVHLDGGPLVCTPRCNTQSDCGGSQSCTEVATGSSTYDLLCLEVKRI